MKLHQVLFYALIILLPVQLGRHFWPEWSYVLGLKIDYLSPTVYLTDILIAGILGVWGLEKLKIQGLKVKIASKNLKLLFFPISVFCFLFLNALFSQSSGVAFFKFIKIIEFFLLAFYVVKNNDALSVLRSALPIPIIYSSLIALGQFMRQVSLNGLFWWLGERSFTAFTPGIAKAVFNGRLIMRPYATFPHPNVLAGFILVSLVLIGISNHESGTKKAIKWLAIILGIITITISFSRSTWLVGLLFGAWYLLNAMRNKRKKQPLITNYKLLTTLLIVLVGLGFFFSLTPKFSTDEALFLRFESIRVSLAMIKDQPLTGVGLNNFIAQLPNFWQAPETVRFLQPVHNIFLLVVAETGLVGLATFLWFLILTFKRLLAMPASRDSFGMGNWPLVISLLVILLTGMTDHYWLTLQQTQLLLAVVLGLSWARKR